MIKTWNSQFTTGTTQGGQITLMLAEIDELRAELAERNDEIAAIKIGHESSRTSMLEMLAAHKANALKLKRLEEQKPIAKIPQCHLTGKCDCDAYCTELTNVYLAAGAKE